MATSSDFPGITRRGALRTAGALAAALPVVAAGTGVAFAKPPPLPIGPAIPPGRSVTLTPIVSQDQFPVGALWPPPPSQTTQARLQEMKDAGINFFITGNYLDDGYIVTRALGLADAIGGLHVIVRDDHDIANMAYWFTITDDRSVPMSISTSDAVVMANRAFGTYASHPSFAGFSLLEDTEPWSYDRLNATVTALRAANPYYLRYSNLPPGTGAGYQANVVQYAGRVGAQMLSFDRYPMLADGSNDPDYVNNWADMRTAAAQIGLPVWGYIQTCGFDGHRSPSYNDIAWQVNTSLAYGARGVQYFTYWTPTPERGGNFQPAMIDPLGRRTQHYYDVQDINTGTLAGLGNKLRAMTSESVTHANESAAPARAVRFGPDNYVTETSGSAVVLSRFVDKAGDRWLLVVNRSHTAAAKATVRLRSSSVARVNQFDARTRKLSAQRDAGGLSVSLRPGASTLYQLSKH
ncbi:hypothetical protein [Kutzneria sp. CA-103260]|uniref:hypothetical protein n=1 Tax=Kutzneria sp. CA-103260 TaxID=2802641 RepID=UPI001BA59936|nr:hypothetical protein [Kutzneria sp. CA-103260]QUQ71438.1 hypothetical protein JJ691_92250 [Kutzneria sp. CA-103260]